MKKILLVAISCVAVFAACQKRNDTPENRYAYLTGAKWAIASQEINGVTAAIKECEKDNYFVFGNEGMGRWEEGANNCYGTIGDTTTPPPPPPIDTTDPGPQTKAGDAAPTYTAFRFELTGDQRQLHILDFGAKGVNRDWMIDYMDERTFDIRVTEHINGKLKISKLHLVAR